MEANMELRPTPVIIRLPDCYLIGSLKHLTQRNDISICLYPTLTPDEKPYLDCKISNRTQIVTVRFGGHRFMSVTNTVAKPWWTFKPQSPVLNGMIDGVAINWFKDFFTKSASFTLRTPSYDYHLPRFSLK
jgi:hypothetical protein